MLQNIEGRSAYKAKYVCDAFADANVAYDCGVKCEVGEDDDYRTCQDMTLMFLIANVPDKYKEGLCLGEIMADCYKKEGSGKQMPFKYPPLITLPNSKMATIQFTHMNGVNPICATSLTEAIIEGRRQVIEAFEMLKTYSAEFSEIELVSSAPMIGVRESRRINGEYTVDLEHMVQGKMPEDCAAVVNFHIDIHSKKEDVRKYGKIQKYGIPIRAMIPKSVKNLIVAGRAISGTHVAMSSYRVTSNCCAMGEAAGEYVAGLLQSNE